MLTETRSQNSMRNRANGYRKTLSIIRALTTQVGNWRFQCKRELDENFNVNAN